LPYKDTLAHVDYSLSGEDPFSYHCNACCNCCHNKAIRVTPYEVLRLARRLGVTTTQFIAQHTEAGGTVLRMSDDNDRACIFLEDTGCGVHSDRPLACRLYPLARSISPDGEQRFGLLTPHPKSSGEYGASGSVNDYLENQGVAQFFQMGERYGALYRRMVDKLEQLDSDELQRRPRRRNDVIETATGISASSWIDIDKTNAAFSEAHGRPLPGDIEECVSTHIEAIDDWIASLPIDGEAT
jgi:Fe-S-cluster containining protein